jgi:hypothetical protein
MKIMIIFIKYQQEYNNLNIKLNNTIQQNKRKNQLWNLNRY